MLALLLCPANTDDLLMLQGRAGRSSYRRADGLWRLRLIKMGVVDPWWASYGPELAGKAVDGDTGSLWWLSHEHSTRVRV